MPLLRTSPHPLSLSGSRLVAPAFFNNRHTRLHIIYGQVKLESLKPTIGDEKQNNRFKVACDLQIDFHEQNHERTKCARALTNQLTDQSDRWRLILERSRTAIMRGR